MCLSAGFATADDYSLPLHRWVRSIAVTTSDPADELRQLYPPILTTAHVAEMMHCTIGDVRDKVHRGELEALRWGQQFRFFREEVIASMTRYRPGDPTPDDENVRVDTERN
jgi:excisionase family DNA binding protein